MQQLLQSKGNKDIPFNFEQKNSRQVLAKAIIKHEYPLCMVDHESFREFYNSLYPCFKDIEKVVAMELLDKKESRVAIAPNMWTSTSQKK
ncbi:hypothetical protein LINPERPRIM_LOCUS4844 [Linum perenne]